MPLLAGAHEVPASSRTLLLVSCETSKPTLRRLRLRAHVCARACPCVRRCAVQNRRMRKAQKDADRYPPSFLVFHFSSLVFFRVRLSRSSRPQRPTACSLYFFFFYPLFLLFFFLHQVSTKLPLFFFSSQTPKECTGSATTLYLSLSPRIALCLLCLLSLRPIDRFVVFVRLEYFLVRQKVSHIHTHVHVHWKEFLKIKRISPEVCFLNLKKCLLRLRNVKFTFANFSSGVIKCFFKFKKCVLFLRDFFNEGNFF